MFYNYVYIISDHTVLTIVAQLWSKHPLLFMKLNGDT